MADQVFVFGVRHSFILTDLMDNQKGDTLALEGFTPSIVKSINSLEILFY